MVAAVHVRMPVILGPEHYQWPCGITYLDGS